MGKENSIYRGLQNFNKLGIEDKQIITDAKLPQHKKVIQTLIEQKRRTEHTVQ